MANDKGMSEDKQARLEAIRAANAAKKAEEGGVEPAAPVVAMVAAAPATAAAAPVTAAPAATERPAAVGASMPEDKKAKLEAIRAANAAKKAEAGEAAPVAAATSAPAAAAPRPAATTSAAPAAAPRPAAARPAAKAVIMEDDRVPVRVHLVRMAIGAVFGMILCVMLATMTGNYLIGAAWGLILGALAGLLVLSWPPERTTGE